ncbi:MAG: UvrD-helicase domain-containing protein [Patescibacteria group bacterium]
MPDNLLENLNPEQLAAVMHDKGPLMIIAGAGTGKTTVITHRIGWLIEQGKAKADEILALTFTEKAAAEMEERVDRLLPFGYLDLWISTFHGFCERLLKQHALDIGIPNDFKLLNQTDAWLLVRQNFASFELNYYRPAGNPTKFIQAMLEHFSRAKDEGVSPEEYLAHVEELVANQDATNAGGNDEIEVARLRELANAYHIYQRLLLQQGALDFGDLIFYTIKLLKDRPAILAKYQKQFRYVLVDEFQDTNWAQYELVKMLAAPENNLTVVSDDDQSIYRFRGASISNVLQFKKDYPEVRQIALTRNYRSRQRILDVAYEFIQANNPNRLEVQLEGLSKRLNASHEGEGHIEHIHCSSLEEEATRVAERILELHKQGTPLQEIAILVRANDTAEPFVRQLDRVGLPYLFFALKGLYVKPIILDALAYLRVIDQPNASPSLYRLLSHPMLAVDVRDIVTFTHECYRRGKALIQVLESARTVHDLHIETFQRIEELLHQLNAWRESSRRKPVSELYVEVMKASGILGYVNGMSERKQMEEFRYLQQFYERLKRFELASADRSLHTFLQEFEHEQSSGDEGALKADPEQGPECVQVMTIHSAKGLEFTHVFIVSMVDRRFPTSEQKEAIPLSEKLIKEILPQGDIHLEEERRLMYVALTRAKEAVYLTSADDYGGTRKKKLSRFLHELGLYGTFEPEREILKSQIPEMIPYQPSKTAKAFSFTQLAAFETCPLQYKYAHLLHVPVYGRYVMSFGKTMHNTLQKFFELLKGRIEQKQSNLFDKVPERSHAESSEVVGLKELMQLYDASWIDEWYENDVQREEYRAKGKKILTDYFAEMLITPPKPLHLEKGFTLKFGDVSVKGQIDRIDSIEGGVEIIDYKTGTPKKGEKMSAEDKRQLMIYQLAADRCFDPPLKVLKLTYHYLEDNSRVSFLGKPDELEALIAQIQDTATRIRSSKFTPTPGFMCRYCDFRDICEFRQ